MSEQTDLRIIVPCGEGEEKEYYKKDEFLKTVIPIENDVPRNIVSPTRVKGLEFNRVIIYGFGKYFVDNFCTGVKSFSEIVKKIANIDSTEHILPIEYFINWLYVAASRPKKRLFVIDDDSGINSFWDFARIDKHSDILLQNSKNADLWEDKLGLMQPGSERSWGEEQEDPIEVAKQYQQDGIDRQDPYFLRQAASLFKRIQLLIEYHKCLGYAYFYDGGDFLNAGKEFHAAGLYDKSLMSLWMGQHYQEIAELLFEKIGFETRLEVRFSKMISGFLNVREIRSFLDHWLSLIDQQDNYDKLVDNKWTEAITSLKDKVRVSKLTIENIDEWSKIWTNIRSLKKRGLIITSEVLTEFAIRAKDYKSVVEIGYEKHPKFSIAKTKYLVTIDPDTLSDSDANYLAEFYYKEKEFAKSWALYCKTHNLSGLEKLIVLIPTDKQFNEEEWVVRSRDLLRVFVFHKEWKKSVKFLTDYRVDDKHIAKLHDTMAKFKPLYDALFVEAISDDPLLVAADNETRTIVSDFLYERYVKLPIRIWRPFIHPVVVGAAFERCGRHVDALEFYDKIIRQTKDESELIKYQMRWIVNKYNLSKWVEIEKNDRDGAERHRDEARMKLLALNMKREDIPDLPYKTSDYLKYRYSDEIIEMANSRYFLSNGEQQKDTIVKTPRRQSVKSFNIDDISIKYSAEKKRINLEDNVSLSTAMVDIKLKNGRSDDIQIDVIDQLILFRDWNIEVDLGRVESGIVIIKKAGNSEIKIRL